jgi:hypothetical protein
VQVADGVSYPVECPFEAFVVAGDGFLVAGCGVDVELAGPQCALDPSLVAGDSGGLGSAAC